MREYCLGERGCFFDIISDQEKNFPTNRFKRANYLDPNYNIGMPIFSIHGNHDDPCGEGNLCAVDLLSVNNLINYFGKTNTIEDIVISPILIVKGNTKLALYGLGSIKDERLVRTFRNNKVKMLRPTEDPDHWFSLLVLHQNRAAHGANSYIKEEFLPDFLNLVIWGHEHECLLTPEENSTKGFFVSQPGSSIATSLSDGEAVQKKIGILEIQQQPEDNAPKFRMKEISLKTVRPFVLDEITLADHDEFSPNDMNGVTEYIEQKVNKLIERAVNEYKIQHGDDGGKNGVPLPLVRLKVECSGGFEPFNISRFGQKFVDRVANPHDILLFYRRKQYHIPSDHQQQQMEGEGLQNIGHFTVPQSDTVSVEELLSRTIAKDELKLKLLNASTLMEALSSFVDKDENRAISEFVDWSIGRHRQILQKEMTEKLTSQNKANGDIVVDNLEEMIERQKGEISGAHAKSFSIGHDLETGPDSSRGTPLYSEMDNESVAERATPIASGQSRPMGGPRRGRGRAVPDMIGRKRQAVTNDDVDLSDDGDATNSTSKPPPKKRPASNPVKRGTKKQQQVLSFFNDTKQQASPK
eukprot:Ihof_evm1s559 gene=Ihof_evmTU1s559